MTRIADKLRRGRTYSFEFFPPKTDEAVRGLQETIADLGALKPSFVSVTYGAGGSTRDRTRDVVVDIERLSKMTTMAHLTCIGHTRSEIVSLLEEYTSAGVENVLALAGDPPEDQAVGKSEFTYAIELIELIQEMGTFSVGVAAHPELHPRSSSRDADRRHLAAKLQAADFAITQFFFEAEPYLRMIDELEALGNSKPVIPGIIPVTNASQVARFAKLAGAEFPPRLAERFEAVADDPASVRALGVEVASEMASELLEAGVPGLHFYTLNRSTATREIYENLALGPGA